MKKRKKRDLHLVIPIKKVTLEEEDEIVRIIKAIFRLLGKRVGDNAYSFQNFNQRTWAKILASEYYDTKKKLRGKKRIGKGYYAGKKKRQGKKKKDLGLNIKMVKKDPLEKASKGYLKRMKEIWKGKK